MSDFFKTPAGIAVFTVIAVAVIIFIIEVNYKYFTKSFLDFLFALVFTIVLSPLFGVLAAISYTKLKQSGGGRILTRQKYLGYKGREVELYSYSLASFDEAYMGGYADFLKKSRLEYLPRLLNVLQLKLSFVGIKPLAVRDGGFIEDEDYERFNARAGLVSPAIYKGSASLTYEQMFAAERRYVKRRELFYDVGAVLLYLVNLLRGGENRLGEADKKDYCEVLLERGEITREQIELAESDAAQMV